MYARMFALLVLCAGAFAQRGQYAVPPGTDLNKYPTMPGKLSTAQMARMGLKPKVLTESVDVFNHARGLQDKNGRFMFETLLPGTTVLVDDKTGVILYKDDCGNRISELLKPKVTSTFYPAQMSTRPIPKRNAWQQLSDGLEFIARDIWRAISAVLSPLWWLLIIVAGIALILLVLGLLAEALRRIFHRLSTTLPPYVPPAKQAETIPPGPQVPPAAPIKEATPPTPNIPPPTTDPSNEPKQEPKNSGQRSFFSMARGDANQPHMFRWQGLDIHHYERGTDGVHTLRFTHHEK